MKYYAIAIITGILLGFGMPAHSGIAAYAQENLIIVRDDGMYPPNEVVMNGELAGIHIDLIRTVAEILNLDITFQSLPWKSAIDMLQSGQADAITYLNPTPEREQFAIFLDENTLSEQTFVLLTTPRVASLIESPLDFEQLRQFVPIGIQTAHSTGPQVARLDGLYQYDVDTLPQLITLLRSGRIPLAFVCWQEFHEQYQGTLAMEELVPVYPPIYSTKAYIAFSKVRQHEELAQQFANALHDFKQTPEYGKLLGRYQFYPQQALK